MKKQVLLKRVVSIKLKQNETSGFLYQGHVYKTNKLLITDNDELFALPLGKELYFSIKRFDLSESDLHIVNEACWREKWLNRVVEEINHELKISNR